MHVVAIFVGVVFLVSFACNVAAIHSAMRLNGTSERGD